MNQNLIKLFKQLEGIWKQLNAGQRISIIAATLVVLGGTMSIAVWSGRTDYSLLYGRLSDAEAAKVIQALDADKTPYKISGGGSSIMVPTDKVHHLRMQLAGRGIPKADGVGFEIFDKPNFGISDFVQRANYVRAIQGELSRTIGQLDEIESARVMIVMPENRLLLDKDKRPTASVFVRVRGNMQLSPQAVNSIRFLVANSVEGLKPNFVAVVDNQGNSLSENNDGDPMVGMSSTQLGARKSLELYMAKKAESMLEKVLGPGQAIVRVSAEINFDTITRTDKKYDPEGQVIKSQTKNDDTTDSMTGGPSVAGGTGGAGANDPNNNNANSATNAAASTPSTRTNNRKITDTTTYELSETSSTTTLGPGGLRRLSAAVTIAAKMEGTGATRKMVSRTPEELARLKSIVQSALGIQSTGTDQITLEEFPFNDQVMQEITQQVDQQQKYQLYWDIGKNVLYMVLALGAFLMLLRMIKRTPVDDIPLGVPIGRLGGRGNGNGHLNYRGDGDSGPVTVEVLHTLIKENPGNVTQAVRRYLSKSKSSAN
jgi:flagellar M-ring protein FliF